MNNTIIRGKKALSIILAFLLATALSACHGQDSMNSADPVNDVSSQDITSELEISLANYDGWWHMDDNYPDGLHLFEIFYLDGTGESFKAVDSYGNELYTGRASMDGEANIILSVDVFGDILMTPASDGLYDDTGILAFVKGEEPEAPDMRNLFGKWYLNGDTSAEYYELTDSAYNRIRADGIEYGEDRYSISAITEHNAVGETIEVTHITFGDSAIASSGKFAPGFELFVVSDFGDNYIYVRDSAIGTAEGDAALLQASVIYDNWRAIDESCAFEFYNNGSFEYRTRVNLDGGMYSFEAEDSGTWVLAADKLTISWNDGSEEVCDFTGNAFYVSSLDVTIFNGKANSGVLDNWYGEYIGETGAEVIISESILDNTISVSLYLNDEIGSMYSTSLELELGGNTAADEYITLNLDGNTLTVEPLNSFYEDYGGSYEKKK